MRTHNIKSLITAVVTVFGIVAFMLIGISPTSAQETDYEVPVNRRVLPIAAPADGILPSLVALRIPQP